MKALIIIDMQTEIQRRLDSGRDHVNTQAATQIKALATAFRQQNLPVIHIRHCRTDPSSPFHPDAEGYQPMPCSLAQEGEPVLVKTTSSAFASTDLGLYLRDRKIDELVVTGAVAGFCVNSTVRAGADLGFKMLVVRDAVIGFDLPEDGLSAQVVFDVTMALLQSGFAHLTETDAILTDDAFFRMQAG